LDEEKLAELYSQLDHHIYESEADGRSRTARRHFEIVRQFVRGGKLLDVGCASGGFLSVCSGNGFEVTGVEPATALANKAREAISGRGEILCGTLQEVTLRADSFDVLTLWDVLEHVPEPEEFLRLCRSLLKHGGYLFANVPDLGSFQAKILGRRWPLLLPEHFNYFTRKSLALCAGKAGFRLLRFGRRSAYFSIAYTLHRLAQHNIWLARIGKDVIEGSRLARIILPVPLGETYGAWLNSGR
jgi:SAM-dependent methyltransferase